MKTAIYYPKRDRLDLLDKDGRMVAGFLGRIAHRKAIMLAASGNIVSVNTEMESIKDK